LKQKVGFNCGDIVEANDTKGGIQKSIVRRRSMISEIDLLREDIPRLEKKFGAGNPFVEVLKAQLALLQNQRSNSYRGFGIIGGL